MKVQNKVIVVTGGGNGIGRELALWLLTKGAKVAAVDINEANLQETQALSGAENGNLSLHIVDITDRMAVEALPGEVIAKHGAVDGLINNAGIVQPLMRLNDLEYDVIERVLNVNFYGMVYMTKTFLPYLLERPVGHIVNISSMGGFLPVLGQTLYGASKAAVKLLTEGLHAELMETNVGVTIVFPGGISTNIFENSGVEALDIESSGGNTTTPEAAAKMIVDGMERDKYRVLVGNDAKMMDLLSRISPERAMKMIYQQTKSLLGE